MRHLLQKIFVFLGLSLWLLSGCTGTFNGGTETGTPSSNPPVPTSSMTADQLALFNSFPSSMITLDMTEYLSYDPLRSIRCRLPIGDPFNNIADQLGGFTRPYQIPIAENATEPRILSGFEAYLDTINEDGMDPSSTTEITRPDLVGQIDNIALYLSQPLGLFVIEINETDPTNSPFGCTTSIPGEPLNFILKENNLMIFTNSIDHQHGAVLKYILDGSTVTFQSGVFLENKPILDARLFNDTLAVYSDDNTEETGGDDRALTFISTNSDLTVISTDQLLHEEAHDDIGIVSSQSYFEPFVSASDNYLVVSQNINDKFIDHYATYTINRCTAYEERTRAYCHTQWEKVANPDYVSYPSSSVSCSSDLLSCLESKGPTLSRYIYVNTGTVCEDITYQACTSSVTTTGSYPVYRDNVTTQFIVYRFEEDDFVRLDDELSTVEGESLIATGSPVQMEGSLDNQSQLYFSNGFFYALSTERELTSFAIEGNSIIQTSVLSNIGSGDSVSAVRFSPEKVFVNVTDDDSYRDTLDFSSINVISLANPTTPIVSGQISLAGDLDQLFILSDNLLGFGSTFYGAGANRVTVGTMNLFDNNASELDNLLLGVDYSHYTSNMTTDDQVATLNESSRHVLLPYTNYGFIDEVGYNSKYRLTLAGYSSTSIQELATFDFQELVKRSLSINSNLAITFSDHLINILLNDSEWSLFSYLYAYPPAKAYEISGGAYWISVMDFGTAYQFDINSPETIFSNEPLDRLLINKASTQVCLGEKLYFTNNGILLVSEVAGAYTVSEDCPTDDELQLEYRGWHVTDSGTWELTDQTTLQSDYQTILADYQCVIDTSNFEGEEITDLSEVPEEATCFTRREYDAIRGGY